MRLTKHLVREFSETLDSSLDYYIKADNSANCVNCNIKGGPMLYSISWTKDLSKMYISIPMEKKLFKAMMEARFAGSFNNEQGKFRVDNSQRLSDFRKFVQTQNDKHEDKKIRGEKVT